MLEVIRNVTADAHVTIGEDSLPMVVVSLPDRDFTLKGKEARIARFMDEATLRARFNGGTFIFYNDSLVDYRFSDYRGFVHTDEAIQALSEHVGFSAARRNSGAEGLINAIHGLNGFVLGGTSGEPFRLDHPVVQRMGEGVDSEIQVMHTWSPFDPRIQTNMMVQRLICANGMIGTADWASFQTHLVSNWQENLAVIGEQLKPAASRLLGSRIEEMIATRASVKDLLKVQNVLPDASYGMAAEPDELVDPEIARRVERLRNQVSPYLNLDRYMDVRQVIESGEDEHAPSHLSQYDVWNALTEASTHYLSGRGVQEAQRHANRLMFDERRVTENTGEIVTPSAAAPQRAFFGMDDEA